MANIKVFEYIDVDAIVDTWLTPMIIAIALRIFVPESKNIRLKQVPAIIYLLYHLIFLIKKKKKKKKKKETHMQCMKL